MLVSLAQIFSPKNPPTLPLFGVLLEKVSNVCGSCLLVEVFIAQLLQPCPIIRSRAVKTPNKFSLLFESKVLIPQSIFNHKKLYKLQTSDGGLTTRLECSHSYAANENECQ